jgi:hypothetical protein
MQTRMDNSETLTPLGTQYIGQRQTKQTQIENNTERENDRQAPTTPKHRE